MLPLPEDCQTGANAPRTAEAESVAMLTSDQMTTLSAMRARYQQDHDQFSDRELAHLRFVRWLVQQGRLIP